MLLPSLIGLALLKFQTSSTDLFPYQFHPNDKPAISLSSTEPEIAFFEKMQKEYAVACPDHQYQTHIFSEDPVMVYIENYLHADEAKYLSNLA